MSFDRLMKDLNTTDDEFLRACREHGFMLLPYEPNGADLRAIGSVLGWGGNSEALPRAVYDALVNRRRNEPDVRSPNILSRVDKDLD
jgi:hypothetical protein